MSTHAHRTLDISCTNRARMEPAQLSPSSPLHQPGTASAELRGGGCVGWGCCGGVVGWCVVTSCGVRVGFGWCVGGSPPSRTNDACVKVSLSYTATTLRAANNRSSGRTGRAHHNPLHPNAAPSPVLTLDSAAAAVFAVDASSGLFPTRAARDRRQRCRSRRESMKRIDASFVLGADSRLAATIRPRPSTD